MRRFHDRGAKRRIMQSVLVATLLASVGCASEEARPSDAGEKPPPSVSEVTAILWSHLPSEQHEAGRSRLDEAAGQRSEVSRDRVAPDGRVDLEPTTGCNRLR